MCSPNVLLQLWYVCVCVHVCVCVCVCDVHSLPSIWAMLYQSCKVYLKHCTLDSLSKWRSVQGLFENKTIVIMTVATLRLKIRILNTIWKYNNSIIM